MLSTTINSYLYQEYADDDDLQAFVREYNSATQTFIDWFNKVGLPYYPGLSGPLLDWVGIGIYGLPHTSLVSPAPTSLGPLNTQPLNVEVLNGYIPSSQTTYSLSDDIYQRILTWCFYKGDGNRFCVRWLKRRIMRFLVGSNGVDPQPSQSGFIVGTENTSAIGVAIASGVFTVTITTSILNALIAVNPTVLTLFQLAFEGGDLDLPAQYTYVVTIV